MKKKWIKLILGGWILFLVLTNIIWLYLDKLPPAWDSAAHLKSIVLVNQGLRGQFEGSFKELLGSFWGYPPLVYFLGGAWGLITGLKIDTLVFLNTIFLVGVIFGVYKLAKEIVKEEKVAIISVIIFSLFPVVGEISRSMLLDLPLLVWVVWGLYFWLKSEDLKITKYAWGLLIMLVLASLTKLNGFLYFIPIGILILIKGFKDINIWLKLMIGGVFYGVAVGWWWLLNWNNIYQYLTGLAGQGEKLTDPMNLGQWQTWIHYFKLLFLHQIGPITTILLLVFGWFVPKSRENKKVIWWTIIVYVIFTIIKNKDFRFTLPILIPMAIWLGWGLIEFGKKISKNIAVIIMVLSLIWLGFNFWENAFSWPIKKPLVISTKSLLFEDIDWVGFDDYPVRSVNQEIWPVETIINDLIIETDNKLTVNMLGLIDLEELNNSNLNLYKLMLDRNEINIETLGGITKEFKQEEIREIVNINNYFLVPEENYEAAPFYVTHLKVNNQFRDWIWENIIEFEVIREYQLPNQKKIYLLKKMEM